MPVDVFRSGITNGAPPSLAASGATRAVRFSRPSRFRALRRFMAFRPSEARRAGPGDREQAFLRQPCSRPAESRTGLRGRLRISARGGWLAGSLAEEVALLMCEAEAAIGARSTSCRGSRRQRRVLATVRIPSRRPWPSRHCAHVYAHRLARLQETGLVRLTTQRRKSKCYTPERMYTPPPELVA